MRTRQRPNGRRRAKPQSEPTLSVQGAPQILPSHGPALAGGQLPTICRFGGRLVQNAIGRIETLASAPINQVVSRRHMVSGAGEVFKLTGAIFVAAGLRPRLSNYRRPPKP